MNKLYIAGIGPGGPEYMTRKAYRILQEADLIVGYTLYNDLLRREFPDKTYYSTAMTGERERCLYALRAAEAGRKAVVVCSGDSGVYGMASLVLELAKERGFDVEIEAVPGVTAALGAGALAGAAVSGDFAAVSLSDLLTPWNVIEKRLRTAASGDFVIALYNPGSRKRRDHLKRACEVIGQFRAWDTVCAVAERIGREGENVRFLSLEQLSSAAADMFMTILIGNSSTRMVRLSGGAEKMVTPRGYRIGEPADLWKKESLPERKNAGRERIVIFGGTTEGRQLTEFACEKGVPVFLCVATAYGERMVKPHPLLEVNSAGLGQKEIEELLTDSRILAVLDATHPYAAEITEKTAAACRKTGRRYLRILRNVFEGGADQAGGRTFSENGNQAEGEVFFAGSIRQAADFLDRVQGRALITTGSKEAAEYMKIKDAEERLTFRVLPSREALAACEAAGISGKNLICMQGPFSAEMNACMMRECGASYLVTKISGKNGGFEEKIEAARRVGARVIAVLPPESRSGISMRDAEDVICRIAEELNRAKKSAGRNSGRPKHFPGL